MVTTLATAMMVMAVLAAVWMFHKAPKCPGCGSGKYAHNEVFDVRQCDKCGHLYTVGRR